MKLVIIVVIVVNENSRVNNLSVNNLSVNRSSINRSNRNCSKFIRHPISCENYGFSQQSNAYCF
ncbi:hypothetical protein PIROE2DRAFT_15798 [Piromyces sp. E2]|nr:hypothetical protein PIROE2DRAFT_15798 [Piromyces sp. E2]|eukprot:OUM58845.1 hypothetical protein PIROE2DRAFT_15798 [Piromyces sp. E2]